MKFLLVAGLLLALQALGAKMYHVEVLQNEITNSKYVWEVAEAVPFDELVVCWNGMRPQQGEYRVSIAVKADDWTEELLYATWGHIGQRTYSSSSLNYPVRTNEDTVEILEGKKASGFRVVVEAVNGVTGGVTGATEVTGTKGASLEELYALHASACAVEEIKKRREKVLSFQPEASVRIPIPGRSQLALGHPRPRDLCSPTSTSSVVSYLAGKEVDAISFAARVWDAGSDIYGNWIFNIAESSAELGRSWRAYMARLESFEPIYENLGRGIPTVVSVRGELPGAIIPYKKGHLIAVIGYDKGSDSILCMDPAFYENSQTLIGYDRQQFLKAWTERGQIAYMFRR